MDGWITAWIVLTFISMIIHMYESRNLLQFIGRTIAGGLTWAVILIIIKALVLVIMA